MLSHCCVVVVVTLKNCSVPSSEKQLVIKLTEIEIDIEKH